MRVSRFCSTRPCGPTRRIARLAGVSFGAADSNWINVSFGNGENTEQAYFDVGLDDVASRRIPNSTHAVLFALDALTGKELWNSGNEITSFAHNGELSIANGRVYLGTFDGMLYCYGIAK